jgi:hypothetical protein
MESVKCMVACIYCMVLPKGGSHYEQFSYSTKERRQNLKEKEEEIMLAVEYPNVYRNRFILSTNRLIQTERYFCRGTTPVDKLLIGSL